MIRSVHWLTTFTLWGRTHVFSRRYLYLETEEGQNCDHHQTQTASLSSTGDLTLLHRRHGLARWPSDPVRPKSSSVSSLPVVEIIGEPDSLHLEALQPHQVYDWIISREVLNIENEEKWWPAVSLEKLGDFADEEPLVGGASIPIRCWKNFKKLN